MVSSSVEVVNNVVGSVDVSCSVVVASVVGITVVVGVASLVVKMVVVSSSVGCDVVSILVVAGTVVLTVVLKAIVVVGAGVVMTTGVVGQMSWSSVKEFKTLPFRFSGLSQVPDADDLTFVGFAFIQLTRLIKLQSQFHGLPFSDIFLSFGKRTNVWLSKDFRLLFCKSRSVSFCSPSKT